MMQRDEDGSWKPLLENAREKALNEKEKILTSIFGEDKWQAIAEAASGQQTIWRSP